jgi:tetracycline 7-halogenase / FADH2 O2-dependent halogenase
MIKLDVDVAIVGSGFGGSLTALLLSRVGLSSVLIDRAAHPRFAIGESSTPNADLVLLELAREYDLPRIAPLAKYGTWKRTYPEIVCGLKRGFSYFHHRAGQPFRADPLHSTELLVAASDSDERSDTHWLRADVDGFFAREAQAAGVPLLERTSVTLEPWGPDWRLSGQQRTGPNCEQSVEVRAKFVIDGTGEFGLVPRTLGIASCVDALHTNSRTVFAHFQDLEPWHNVIQECGGNVADHPFCCDHAALHQVFDDGWMYQLRFDNGVTSAGFVLDAADYPLNESLPIQQEWDALLARYLTIARQFAGATVVAPAGGLARSRRLQRRLARAAGDNWALLPHTFGFIDPLHSTGIAQTLAGIQRLVPILRNHWQKPSLASQLANYEAVLSRELVLIDKLVSGCFLARRNFRLFTAFAMLYFAAATTSEHRRATGQLPRGAAFLCTDEAPFRELVEQAWAQVKRLAGQADPAEKSIAQVEDYIATGLRPYNIAGLCDPSARNMYRYTAATKPN